MACAGWRWRPGVLTRSDGRVVEVLLEQQALLLWDADSGQLRQVPMHEARPDLEDAATRGVLLRLVREACHDGSLCPVAHHVGAGMVSWRMDDESARVGHVYDEPTEADLLVAALESA